MEGGNRLRTCVLLMLTVLLLSFQTGVLLPDVTSVSTNKPEYYRGETVTISGKAGSNEWVAIQVNDPNGANVFTDAVQAGGDGSFTCSFQLSLSAPYGTYRVYATGQSGPAKTTTFKVVEYVAPPPPPAKKSSSITITVSETIVALGGSVTVSGSLTPALNTVVEVKVTCPNGTELPRNVLATSGAFTHVFKPDVAGVWSVKASWAGNDEYYGCSSNTVTIIVRGPVALQVFVAPTVTNVGGTIIVYVRTSPPLVGRPLTISFITNKTSTWSIIGAFEVGSGGVAACLFTSMETGKYRFKAEWTGDPTFTPASATSSEVLVVAEALAPEDIINALSQVSALQRLVEEKEAALASCRDVSQALQRQVEGLQHDLSEAQSRISSLESRLAETEARLSETESRLVFTEMVAFIAGLIMGVVIAYLILRGRFEKRREFVGSPLRPAG
ncbi:MAG: hypothetical protein QW334_00685 [Thermofilum sp.]